VLQEAGINITYEIHDIGAKHPNTYKLTLKNPDEQHTLTAISTGGGMIEIQEIDGAAISIAGDYYETLIYFDRSCKIILEKLKELIEVDDILSLNATEGQIIEIKAQKFLNEKAVSWLNSHKKLSI